MYCECIEGMEGMELRHLVYFVTLAEERHFGRAAARLNMTQPPLSQQIRQLEEELGVRLFSRSSRRVELTAAGEVFLAEARKALAQVERAADVAHRAGRGELGRLRVGFVGSATYDVLPAVLRAYRARHPGVDVVLQELSTPQQEEALVTGEIDVGFVRPPLAAPELALEVLDEAPCVLAVPVRHPLAAAEKVSLADLAGVPLVMLSRSTWAGLYDEVIGLCRTAGFSPDIRQEAREFQTVIGLVAGGLGVAVVPAPARNLHTRDVVYKEAAGMPRAVMGLAWRRDDDAPVLHAFVEVARSLRASGV
jgi:DNA-binding transcriptional LysR family regulator